MKTIYVTGRMYVERLDGEANDYEILNIEASASTPFAEPTEELQFIFDGFVEKHPLTEPGIYAVMFSAEVTFTQDYFGDWDVDYNLLWNRVIKLRDDEADAVLGY